MSQYELMYLMPTDAAPDSLQKMLSELETLVKKSGKVESAKEWALKKELAYPIKSHTSANFYLMTFSAPTSLMADLKKKLDGNTVVLRYLITKKN